MGAPGPRCEAMAADYRRGMPVGEIASKHDVQRPAVWKALRRAGILPAYEKQASAEPKAPRERAPAARDLHPDDIARRIVSRDPCGFCGVRRDIGCRHTQAEALS